MDGSRTLLGFENFDDPNVYHRGAKHILKANALNFVLEFDSDKALLASDLKSDSIAELLQTPIEPTKTRWINLWSPEQQKKTVKALATYYGFSPRTEGVMTSDPGRPAVVTTANQQNRKRAMLPWLKDRSSSDSHAEDVEMTPTHERPPTHATSLDMNHYRMVNEVWYYCSVDWDLCVGYNSLSPVDLAPIDVDQHSQRMQNKPQGKRLWTWLILCNDNTIITINENPFHGHEGPPTPDEEEKLHSIRRNLANVFEQLSKVNEYRKVENPINALSIRSGLPKAKSDEPEISEAPSLLFHYLFDDWYTSYSLVAKQEHQYGKQLGKLRDLMFQKPAVEHIEKLHRLGQQLSVLKKIYQSYALIIDRILERQKPVDLSNSTHLLKEHIDDDKSKLTAQTRSYAVNLSSAAIVRFERLRDRIQLYALGEIQDCIDEKEALVGLNFNLITLKQSDAVERLTRITILLAKVTILFMPVSLMTAYFSTQISDLQGAYTSTTYWACFAVIMAFSLLFLVIFGVLSNTLEGKPIYRSMTQTFWDVSRKWLGLKERQKAALKRI
ncbi:MAG: hypothetical protein Q9195_003914 [Heterodermia aff. obscurata]